MLTTRRTWTRVHNAYLSRHALFTHQVGRSRASPNEREGALAQAPPTVICGARPSLDGGRVPGIHASKDFRGRRGIATIMCKLSYYKPKMHFAASLRVQ